MEDLQVVSYPTPSPQPGDLLDDNASEHEMMQHSSMPQGSSGPPPQGSGGQPETPQHGQYVYHYQYYVPGGYIQQPMYYQTPPSAYYSPQMVSSLPSAPTHQRYYSQPGTPTHQNQLEPVNLSQALNQVPHTPVAPTNVDPPTIVQTPNRQRVVIWNYCQFCQNNREPESFFKSHILRDQDGRVICPVLRAYNCPICNNGGGDKAHTKSYCPQLRSAGRLTRRN